MHASVFRYVFTKMGKFLLDINMCIFFEIGNLTLRNKKNDKKCLIENKKVASERHQTFMKVEQVRPQQKPERKLSLKRKKTKLKTLTTDEQMQLDVVPGNTGK